LCSPARPPNGWSDGRSYLGSDVPRPGGENVRLNLWLSGGAPPTDGQEVEVIADSFAFAP